MTIDNYQLAGSECLPSTMAKKIVHECADDGMNNIQADYFDRGGAFWVLVSKSEPINETLGTDAAVSNGGSQTTRNFRCLCLEKSLRGTN